MARGTMIPMNQTSDPRATEVVTLLQDLIRFNTSNYGDHPDTKGEVDAIEYCAQQLREVGYEPAVFSTTSPDRAGLVLRISGSEGHASQRTLLLHAHLDVVPADPRSWTHPPFAGEIALDPATGEQTVWGRGAVDMKHMVAMTLAVLRDWARAGLRPRRDVLLLLLPDEESGGRKGSHWLIEQQPELLRGVTEAVGEVGGFSVTRAGAQHGRYLIATAEKGIAWMRLRAKGRAGHGSMINEENAVTELAAAVARLGEYRFPEHLTPTIHAQLHALGLPDDPTAVRSILSALGPAARLIGATVRSTLNPTVLQAGYKVNVIPGEATAEVDGRFLPGYEDEFFAAVDELLGEHVTREFINHDIALETTFDGPTIAAMIAALRAVDPTAQAVPYMLSAGTDAKAFALLGIRCYGFTPLRLPPGMDFAALFHGVDERVPVPSLHFGVDVLDRFLRSC